MSKVAEIDVSLALAAAAKRCAAAGPSQASRQQALKIIADEGLARPIFRCRACKLTGVSGDLLELEQTGLSVPGLAQVSSRLTGVAAIVCTLGPALEARVSQLCSERSMSLALALDELGNGMLMYAARCAALAARRDCRSQGLTTCDVLTPGGSGLSMTQQAAVLELAGGDLLGISVTGQGMLSPVKSRSMIIGMGIGLSAQPFRRRCDKCSSREHCRYRTLAKHGGRLCPGS